MIVLVAAILTPFGFDPNNASIRLDLHFDLFVVEDSFNFANAISLVFDLRDLQFGKFSDESIDNLLREIINSKRSFIAAFAASLDFYDPPIWLDL